MLYRQKDKRCSVLTGSDAEGDGVFRLIPER